MLWEQTLTKKLKELLNIRETSEKDEDRARKWRHKFSINLLEWMRISHISFTEILLLSASFHNLSTYPDREKTKYTHACDQEGVCACMHNTHTHARTHTHLILEVSTQRAHVLTNIPGSKYRLMEGKWQRLPTGQIVTIKASTHRLWGDFLQKLSPWGSNES